MVYFNYKIYHTKTMEYRINKRTQDKISIIGLGASSISQVGSKEAVETLKMAYEN